MTIRHTLLRSMTASHVVLVHKQHAHVFVTALVNNMTVSRFVLAHAHAEHVFATALVSN